MAEYQITRYSHRYDDDINMLCHAFSRESLDEYKLGVDVIKLWRDLADKCRDYSFFLTTNGRVVGLISGYLTTSVTNDNLVLQELMWYVYPEHRRYGLRLLKHFEDAGRIAGASSVIMVLMHNSKGDQLGAIYGRKGYSPFETHYIKELT